MSMKSLQMITWEHHRNVEGTPSIKFRTSRSIQTHRYCCSVNRNRQFHPSEKVPFARASKLLSTYLQGARKKMKIIYCMGNHMCNICPNFTTPLNTHQLSCHELASKPLRLPAFLLQFAVSFQWWCCCRIHPPTSVQIKNIGGVHETNRKLHRQATSFCGTWCWGFQEHFHPGTCVRKKLNIKHAKMVSTDRIDFHGCFRVLGVYFGKIFNPYSHIFFAQLGLTNHQTARKRSANCAL